MNENHPVSDARPILTLVVNEVVEFDDQAINDPTELANLVPPHLQNRVLVSVVHSVTEFADTAITDPDELAKLKPPSLPSVQAE